jgi:hypothetical protein
VDPLAAAAGGAMLFSLVVGLFLVAPKAAVMAKRRFLSALANPTPEDSEMMHYAVAQMANHLGKIAEDEEGRKLLAPIWRAYVKQVNVDWEMSLRNIASQREQGFGQFSGPIGELREEDVEEFVQELKAQFIGGIVDPSLELFGFGEDMKQKARAVLMTRLVGMSSNGGTGLARGVARAGPTIDFRKG